MKPVLLLLLFLCIAAAGARAGHDAPETGPVPAWVTQQVYESGPGDLDKTASDGYVDIAYEEQYFIPGQATYRRKVVRVLSDAGVQNISDISVSFDPSYARLTFHAIRIIRGGQVINCLDLRRFKIIQEETERRSHIYNGARSAELALEDVRRGDVIDYSYTITGWNPVMSDRFSTFLNTTFAYPFYHVFYKITAPAARPLQVADAQAKVPFAVKQTAGQATYEWKLDNLKPVKEEEKIPSWFYPQNFAMVSEYKSWKEVVDWGVALYPPHPPLSGPLRAKVDGIMADCKTDEARTLAALRFVQDEVRYLGAEMGANSHKPHNPGQIFRQRYGDCKDKAYLLCAMLQAMNIPADPVLINTTDKHAIADYLPSPKDFDHVTLRAYAGGRWHWLDATISGQRGGLDGISFPDYQAGLVITPGNDRLTTIPLQDKYLKDVTETIDVPDRSGEARLKVVTHFSGSAADDVRADFDGSSQSEIANSYKEYYAGYFDKIEADSLSISDDSATGVFTCTEYYTIHDFWKDGERVWLYAYVINGDVRKPNNKVRRMPFSTKYPVKCREDVIVNLPDDRDLSDETHEVQCAAFRLKTEAHYRTRRLQLHFEYEALKDYVTPEELPDYLQACAELEDAIMYGIQTGKGAEAPVGANSARSRSPFVAAAIVVFIFGGITWLIRRKPPAA